MGNGQRVSVTNLEEIAEIRDLLREPLATTAGQIRVEIVIPGITPADAFDANDAVGSRFEIAVPIRGKIVCANLIDPSDVTLALTVHLFSRAITVATSDAAFTISAADARFWVTSILFDAPLDIGSARVAEELNINKGYYSPTGRLWGQCSTTGTPTVANGLSPILVIFIDPATGEE